MTSQFCIVATVENFGNSLKIGIGGKKFGESSKIGITCAYNRSTSKTF